MVRAFERRAIPVAVLDRMLDHALRAPSAGFSQGWAFVVLEGEEQTSRFWDVTLPPERRGAFPWPGLLDAPVLIVPLAHPQAYVERYGEPDKAASGLGEGEAAWPVPYWYVDTAFASLLMLLTAVDEGLGALFFGIFRGESELLTELGVPAGYRPVGAIAVGYPATGAAAAPPSRSTARGRRPVDQVVHRGGW